MRIEQIMHKEGIQAEAVLKLLKKNLLQIGQKPSIYDHNASIRSAFRKIPSLLRVTDRSRDAHVTVPLYDCIILHFLKLHKAWMEHRYRFKAQWLEKLSRKVPPFAQKIYLYVLQNRLSTTGFKLCLPC